MPPDNKERERAATVDAFRKRVEDILQPIHDDMYLQRWLRARNYDIDKAEEMLRNHMIWRKQIGADEILNWVAPEVVRKYFPGGFSGGYDKIGRPVWIEPCGRADMKGLMLSAKKSDLIRHKIYHCELIQKQIRDQTDKLNRHIDGITIIVDVEFLGMKHLWKPALDYYGDVMKIFEAHYPETLRCAYVVNTLPLFPLAFNLMRKFFSEETRQKIYVLGGNWKQTLLKYIDEDQLPVHWGGKMVDPTDGNQFCSSWFSMGGDVDPKYYIHEDIDRGTFTNVSIGSRDSLRLTYKVTNPGSILRWQFLTDNHDIGFSITYDKADGSKKGVTVVPYGRHNCYMVVQDDSVTCPAPGTYIVTFDNTYSWTKGKRLLYQIDLLPALTPQQRPSLDDDDVEKLTRSVRRLDSVIGETASLSEYVPTISTQSQSSAAEGGTGSSTNF